MIAESPGVPAHAQGVSEQASSPASIRATGVEPSRLSRWMIAGALVLGVGLRSLGLNATGYDRDEVYEQLKARESISTIVLGNTGDMFPPLYSLSLKAWNTILRTESASRWWSVVCGAIAMGIVSRAAVEWLGPRGAFWPTLLIACSAFHIYYSQIVRAYALYGLFAALAFWGALRLLRTSGATNWALLVAGTVGGAYTHFYSFPLAAVLWLIAWLAAWSRGEFRTALTATAVCSVLSAPALALLFRSFSSPWHEYIVTTFGVKHLGYAYVCLAKGYSIGPTFRQLASAPARESIQALMPWLIGVGFAYATLGMLALRREWRLAVGALLVPLLLLVPILGVVGNLAGIGFHIRYVVWMVVPYALVLGAGISRWREHPVALAAGAVLLAINGIAIFNRNFDQRYIEDDFRALAAKLEEIDPRHERAVLVPSDYAGDALRYYSGDRLITSFSIEPDDAHQRDAVLAEFAKLHPPETRFWIVAPWLPEANPRRTARDAALRHFRAELVLTIGFNEIYAATVP